MLAGLLLSSSSRAAAVCTAPPRATLASAAHAAAPAAPAVEKRDAAAVVAETAARVTAGLPSGLSPELFAGVLRKYPNWAPSSKDAFPRLPTADDFRALAAEAGRVGMQPLKFGGKANPVEQSGYLASQFEELRTIAFRVRDRFETMLLDEHKTDLEVQRKARYSTPPPSEDSFLNPNHYVALAQMGVETRNPQLTLHALNEFQRARAFIQASAGERAQFTKNGATVPAAIAALPEYQHMMGFLDAMQAMTIGAAEEAARQIQAIDALQAEFDAEEQNVPYETVEENLLAHPEWTEEFNRAHREHRWFELDLAEAAPDTDDHKAHH